MKTEEEKLMSYLKANKILLDVELRTKICSLYENLISFKNVATFYYSSKLFNLPRLSKLSLSFIERYFLMVADSENFLELDFNSVSKILSSNELNIESELQVINIAERWLCYNIEKRNKFARYILSKIRFSLLTAPALKYILDKNSCFPMDVKCQGIIREVLENKTESHSTNFSIVSRYCNQTNFNIILCGGQHRSYLKTFKADTDVYSIAANNIDNVITLPQLKNARTRSKVVCINDEVYCFGGRDCGKPTMPVEKYTIYSNTWEKVADMYDCREDFCASSLMGNVYVIGGYLQGNISSCVQFDTKNRSWKTIARMNQARYFASCAVFEGKVVVCGGYGNNNIHIEINSVEAYDHVDDSWSSMPNMIETRCLHKSVAIRNKLFIVGGRTTRSCEVYESRCNKFVSLKSPPAYCMRNLNGPAAVIAVGSKIAIFGNLSDNVVYYDVENDTWSEDSFEISKNISLYSCAKVPQLSSTITAKGSK